MNITVKLVQEISKNTGRPYLFVEIPVSDTFSIKLFPNSAEQELLKQIVKNSTK